MLITGETRAGPRYTLFCSITSSETLRPRTAAVYRCGNLSTLCLFSDSAAPKLSESDRCPTGQRWRPFVIAPKTPAK